MKQILPIAVAMAAAISAPWGASGLAQVQPDGEPPALAAVAADETRQVEGTVVDIERPDQRVVVLRLDNGIELKVPEANRGPVGGDVKVGGPVVAQYVERGTENEKVATFLRVPEVEAP